MEIVVLTPGRNGSSLIAAILRELGVYMGNCHWDLTKSTPVGYGECLDFGKVFLPIVGTTQIPKHHAVNDNHAGQLHEIITSRRQSYKHWGLKDPRLTWHGARLGRLLLPLLDHPVLIIPERPRWAVVRSFAKAFDWEHDRAAEVYDERQRGLADLLELYDGAPQIKINFNRLLDDPEDEVWRLAWLLNLDGTISDEQIEAAIELVNVELPCHG